MCSTNTRRWSKPKILEKLINSVIENVQKQHTNLSLDNKRIQKTSSEVLQPTRDLISISFPQWVSPRKDFVLLLLCSFVHQREWAFLKTHAGMILILHSILRIINFDNLKIQLHIFAKLKTPWISSMIALMNWILLVHLTWNNRLVLMVLLFLIVGELVTEKLATHP